MPLKISIKQKAAYVVLAIIFSHLFLTLHSYIPDWQAGVILIFTILISTYLFVKYFSNKKSEETTEVLLLTEPSIDGEDFQETFTKVHLAKENTIQSNIHENEKVALPIIEAEIQAEPTDGATKAVEQLVGAEKDIVEEEVTSISENDDPEQVEDEVGSEPVAVSKRLNRDLMETLVQQLHWYKKKLSVEQYEQLIVNHAKEQLHDNDYYLFASMLRDHYIKTEQLDKLKSLLNRLKQRYHNKIIILKEITFFEEKFFQS